MLYIRKHNFRIFAAFAVAMPMLFAAMSLCCCTKGTPYYSKPVEVSIAHLKELYKGHPVTVTENCFIEGVVVSSDKWGNFNKSIFVQDGTGGIEVKLDMDKIFAVYNIGGMVRIYCKGLSLGAYGRLIQLGSAPAAEYETGYIAREDIAGHIEFMGLPEEEILPLSLDFAELTTENAGRIAGCKATFRGVRFVEADDTATWC